MGTGKAVENKKLDAALAHARAGIPVFPLHNPLWDAEGKLRCSCIRPDRPKCANVGKHPRIRGWQEAATTDPEQIRAWWTRWPDANIGAPTGSKSALWVLDVDTRYGGDDTLAELERAHGKLPDTWSSLTGSGGEHRLFRWVDGIPNGVGEHNRLGVGLDVRGEGGLIVAPGSMHASGNTYEWEALSHPDDLPLSDAPAWLLELVTEQSAARPAAPDGAKLVDLVPFEPVINGCGWLQQTTVDAATLSEPRWYAQLSILGQCQGGEQLAHDLSQAYPGYSPEETAAKLGHARQFGPYTCRYIRQHLGGEPHCAECPNWERAEKRERFSPVSIGRAALFQQQKAEEFARLAEEVELSASALLGDPGGSDPPPPPPDTAPAEVDDRRLHLTDLGNAELLVERYGQNLRHCDLWGKWFAWDGTRWRDDGSGIQVERWAKDTARYRYVQAAGIDNADVRKSVAEWAKKSESVNRIGAMIRLAQSEPGIAIRPDELDADPWLLNVRNGTLNLRTGELQPHRREDLITRVVPVDFDPAAGCPIFLRFLRRIMGGSEELVQYLQRCMGHSLTGIPPDRALLFFYGEGRNGKSTLVEVWHDLLGPYATKTRAETLLASPQGESIPNDLAELKGARLVTTSELSEGRRLNEARIKDLTGRDRIKARFLRQEFFEFRPEFKLVMYGNHRPPVRSTDDGIWDRVKLVPFAVRIPDDEVDPELPDKLRSELPGILAWALQGCLEWQRKGLAHPDEVRAATLSYRQEQDPLTDFLRDACVIGPGCWATNTALWDAYEAWCRENRERFPLGRNSFRERLEKRGFTQGNSRARGGRFWEGVGLVDPTNEDPQGTLGEHCNVAQQQIPVQPLYARACGVNGDSSLRNVANEEVPNQREEAETASPVSVASPPSVTHAREGEALYPAVPGAANGNGNGHHPEPASAAPSEGAAEGAEPIAHGVLLSEVLGLAALHRYPAAVFPSLGRPLHAGESAWLKLCTTPKFSGLLPEALAVLEALPRPRWVPAGLGSTKLRILGQAVLLNWPAMRLPGVSQPIPGGRKAWVEYLERAWAPQMGGTREALHAVWVERGASAR